MSSETRPPDIGDESVRADPYPLFARLRREAPLYRDGDGIYRLTRYDDISAAFLDERLTVDDERWQRCDPFAEAVLAGFDSPAARTRRQWFLFRDGPDHRRLRSSIASAFTPRATARYRPAIQAAMNHLVDGLATETATDLMTSIIRPLPATALVSTLEFPRDEWEQCATWVQLINRTFDRRRTEEETERMNAAVEEFDAYLADKIARASEGDGRFSSLVRQARRRGVDDAELIPTLTTVFVAGQHVMGRLLGSYVIRLLQLSEEERDRFRHDPARIDAFFDEMLRWDCPAVALKRIATEDVAIDGGTIPCDSVVVLMLGSAHRDETVFPDPDTFDPERRDPRAIPFGVGEHFCLGAYFARLEAEVFIETLLRRFRGLRLVGEPPALPVARGGVPPLNVVWNGFF